MNKEKRSPKTLAEIKQAKIFKQLITNPQHYPPTFLPRFPVLNLSCATITGMDR